LLVIWDGSETGERQLQWLVQDHLGSTRMMMDRSGSLGGVRRHDFAPSGEELSAGVGIRSAALGYGDDSTRQKFEQYERDSETGLDFAQNRYLSSTQGRFTSPDPTLLSVNAFNPQSWNRYSFVLNNPLLYVDPLGLWELYAEDLYKTKKNKDGTEIRVFDRRVVYARKTKDSDDGASLAAQLGLKGKDAANFAAKIGDGNNVRMADQGGDVGRVFRGVEEGLTEQVKWEAKNSGKLDALAAKGEYGPSHSDCSRTACQIGLGQFLGLQVGTNVLDPLLNTEARPISPSDALVGDIIRYAKADNVATHFANFIFRNDDGTPVAFSKSGEKGMYEIRAAARLQYPNYGTIRGRNEGDSGYYRRR